MNLQHMIEFLFGLGKFTIFSTILLFVYLLKVFPLYRMYKMAGLKNPEFAFIPIIGELKLYNLANLSSWCCLVWLLTFIPFVGPIIVWIFNAYVRVKVCCNFGVYILLCILSIFISPFIYWYIVLTNRTFLGVIDYCYKEDIY